ncbi:MAG TPA: SpoIIE family protein phosphatase [Solirubrobacteraceae bacterium]|nr:SpoIIE family protein phosphatase [Solirubrobacteraceae bacterium]
MSTEDSRFPDRPLPRGTGQAILPPVELEIAPSEQVRLLYSLSDPTLSELELDEFLDELLARVQEALSVDTVAILLFDEASQQLVARAARGLEEEVERGVRIPIGRGFAGRIASERVAIFIADVDHADILNPILGQRGIRSLLGIPLIVEGSLIGVLHVGSLTPREFGQTDLAVLQVAAVRAAPGIERAQLLSALRHEQRVAMVLQRSLLPKQLVEAVGVSVGARYVPASDEVGGDWYDMFELDGGRLGIAIGDVVGHGLRAAALMGQLRTALQAYALQGADPGRTLVLVDRFVQALPDFAMATAAYAVLDPDTGRVRVASAGHLPPLVVGGDTPRVVELIPAPPLGAFPYGHCSEHETTLAPGETLVFYTDGLIERPGIPLTQSIEAMLELLGGQTSVDDLCHLAIQQLVPVEGLRDDVALIAIQNSPVPDELMLEFPAEPRVLSEARRALRRWLRHVGADRDQAAEITLAASEACANAIEHAYSPAPARFTLHARAHAGEVTLTVRDGGQWREPRGEHRGRGLTIMKAAMHEVEANSSSRGTEIVMRRRLHP